MNVGDKYIHKVNKKTVEIVKITNLCVFIREPGDIQEELMSTERFLWNYIRAEEAGIDYWRGGEHERTPE